ncbi:hypothetical protein [Streptomyces sp. NPDC005423]
MSGGVLPYREQRRRVDVVRGELVLRCGDFGDGDAALQMRAVVVPLAAR